MKYLLSLLSPFHGIQRNLDRLAVAVIICIVAVVMMRLYLPMITKTHVLGSALEGTGAYRLAVSYHWALHGQWPSQEEALSDIGKAAMRNVRERELDPVTMTDTAIHIRAPQAGDDAVLTCRPAVLTGNPSWSISWFCGENLSLEAGWTAPGEDRTSIAPYLIPNSLK